MSQHGNLVTFTQYYWVSVDVVPQRQGNPEEWVPLYNGTGPIGLPISSTQSAEREHLVSVEVST